MLGRVRPRELPCFSFCLGVGWGLLVRCRLEIIDRFVSRGSHFVECVLLGEEGLGVPAFKIIGVFST